MTEKQFNWIIRKTYLENGVLIIPAPLEMSGYLMKEGDDEYIFLNTSLSKVRRQSLIKYFMKKDRKN